MTTSEERPKKPKLWCPGCEKVQVCKAIPSADSEQRRRFTSHKDVQWFQRRRECKSCGHEFVTAECSIKFLVELTELRKERSDIKARALSYISAFEKVSKGLKKLL